MALIASGADKNTCIALQGLAAHHGGVAAGARWVGANQARVDGGCVCWLVHNLRDTVAGVI